ARRQWPRGAEYDVSGALLGDRRVPPARALRTGVERRLPKRNRLGQRDARLGLLDREGPAGAGRVPVKLIVIREESDLPRGAIANDVFVPPDAEQSIGVADAHSHPVRQALGDKVFRRAVTGHRLDVEANLDAGAVAVGVRGRKITQDAAAD